MKKVFKIGCLGFLVLIVLGALIGVFAGGGDEAADTATPDTAAPAVETPAEEAPAEEAPPVEEAAAETEVGIGTALEVGDVTFTVNSKETAAQVGPSVLPETASGKYVVLDVVFKNNGNEAVTVDSSFFKLKQGEKTFEADAMASMSANQGEDGTLANAFFLEEVNPGSEISGKVAFDVAPDIADAADLTLQVQSGFFGTETGTINLQ